MTDVAEIVGVSRQNMRNLMLAHPGSFPAPVHAGGTSIWYSADVLASGQGQLFAGASDAGRGAGGPAEQRGEGSWRLPLSASEELEPSLAKRRYSVSCLTRTRPDSVKRNLKLIQLRTQTQFRFDTPAHTVIS